MMGEADKDQLNSDRIDSVAEYNGLSVAEAAHRLAQYGPNELAQRQGHSAAFIFLSHFANPLVLILLSASVVSAFAGEVTNASIIAVIILLSVTLDYIQERRSDKAADALRASVALHATVIREGRVQTIPARELVPGELVQLAVGDL